MVAAAAPLTSCLLSRYGNDYNKSGEGGGDSGVSYSERYPGPGAPTEYVSQHTGPMTSTSYWYSSDIPE